MQALIDVIKDKYAEHNAVEANLVILTREHKPAWMLRREWRAHDKLEREIIELESYLPDEVVDKLREGRL